MNNENNGSKTVKHQEKEYRAEWSAGREKFLLVARVRWDDCCGNGHNSFAITGDVYSSARPNSRDGAEYGKNGKRRGWISGGCVHDAIKKRIPALAPFIKWHLSDAAGGPMHYEANAMYRAGGCRKYGVAPRWDYFATTVVLGAVDGDPADTSALESMNGEELRAWLKARQPALIAALRRDVEALGFVW